MNYINYNGNQNESFMNIRIKKILWNHERQKIQNKNSENIKYMNCVCSCMTIIKKWDFSKWDLP